MGKVANVTGPRTTLWDAVANQHPTLCTTNTGPAFAPSEEWAVPSVVAFAPIHGTLRLSSSPAIPDQYGRQLTGSANVLPQYCNGAPSAGNGAFRALFGRPDGTNTPHPSVSFFLHSGNNFSSDITVTFENRTQNLRYEVPQATREWTDDWYLYSYYDPCHPIDAVKISGSRPFFVADFAWDEDSIFDQNVVPRRRITRWRGHDLIVVPRYCGAPRVFQAIPLLRSITHRFRQATTKTTSVAAGSTDG